MLSEVWGTNEVHDECAPGGGFCNPRRVVKGLLC